MKKLVRVLIESGLLYTLSIVILFTLYMTSNNAQLGVSDSVSFVNLSDFLQLIINDLLQIVQIIVRL